MKQEELYKLASDLWIQTFEQDKIDQESDFKFSTDDRMFWINGFMKAANLFGDIDNLPSPQQLEEKGQLMGEMFNKLFHNQKNLNPEYGQIISDNFNDLT